MSSNSNHSRMAASAFAALSHLDDFDENEAQDTQGDEDHASQHTTKTPSESAEAAADSTVEHHVEQASSIDKADASDRATIGAQQPPGIATPQAANHADAQSASADISGTPFEPGTVATPPPESSHAPETRRAASRSPAAGERQDSQPSQAGSSPGSQTFDSALHEGISELVKAPNSADHTRQSGQGTYSVESSCQHAFGCLPEGMHNVTTNYVEVWPSIGVPYATDVYMNQLLKDFSSLATSMLPGCQARPFWQAYAPQTSTQVIHICFTATLAAVDQTNTLVLFVEAMVSCAIWVIIV